MGQIAIVVSLNTDTEFKRSWRDLTIN